MSEIAPAFSAPEAASVRVEFTYEFDDFAEASKSWAAPSKSGGKTGLFGKLNRNLLGWVLFIGLVVMLFLLMQNRQTAPGARPRVPPPAASNNLLSILLPVVPWLLIFSFIWYFAFRQIRAFPAGIVYMAPAMWQRHCSRTHVIGQESYGIDRSRGRSYPDGVAVNDAERVSVLFADARPEAAPAGHQPLTIVHPGVHRLQLSHTYQPHRQ